MTVALAIQKKKAPRKSSLDVLTEKNTAIIQNLKKRLYAYALLNNHDEDNLSRFYVHVAIREEVDSKIDESSWWRRTFYRE